MVAFIILYLVGYVIAFFLRSIVEFVHNGEYTLRDVFMGLLVSCSSFVYIIICFTSWISTYIVKLIFLIEEFINNEDMYADKVLLTKAGIMNIFKKRIGGIK